MNPTLKFKDAWGYSPAPETFAVDIQAQYGLFIGGEFREGVEGKLIPSLNPATEEKLFDFTEAGSADVDGAVKAARKALPGWRRLSGMERGKYLFRIARRLQERAREFAVLETMDGGKPIKEARDIDIPEAAKHFF